MKRFQRILTAALALCILLSMHYSLTPSVYAADTTVESVVLYLGQTTTLSNSDGMYSEYSTTNPSVARVSLTTVNSYPLATSLTSGEQYYISSARKVDENTPNYMLTAETHTSYTNSLTLSGSLDSLPESAIWTLDGAVGSYGLFHTSGMYLDIGSGTAAVGNGGSQDIKLVLHTSGRKNPYWQIIDTTSGYGLNHHGGGTSTRAAGYNASDNGNCWYFYETNTGYTDITFTATKVGSTDITVGTTTYHITVLEHPEVPVLESTPFVNGANIDQKITKLTITAGFSLVDLDILEEFIGSDSVSWSSADNSITTVDSNGTITGVTAGTTDIIATINGQAISVPVTVLPYAGDAGSEYRTYNAYVDRLHYCAAYYSLNCSSTLVSLSEGELIYIQAPKAEKGSIDFFGRPLDGYALNEMGATNGQDQYSAINSDSATDTDLYNKNEGIGNQKNLFGQTMVSDMISSAIALNCQGGFAFTRYAGYGDMDTSLTFIAEQLPTFTKDVVGILGTEGTASDYRAYVPGMTAKVGEIVWFRVMVTNYVTEGEPLIFSDASISDTLTGATLVKVNYNADTGKWENTEDTENVTITDSAIIKYITDDLNKSITQDTIYRYIFAYEITAEDLEKTIINTAEMSFSYQSKYNSSSFTLDATASAQITATEFPPKHLVLDFGLPTTVYFEDWGAGKQLVSATANHGDVSLETVYSEEDSTKILGWNITYTPTQVLQNTDTVYLTSSDGTIYSLYVYPATTVYYEEGFATYSGFAGDSKGTGSQQGSFVGDSVHYGFDFKYASEEVGPSNGTSAVSSAFGGTAEFTFTGTGVEIYGNCTSSTGRIVVTVKDSAGKLVRFYQVHTNTGGGTDITQPQKSITAYSLPLVSVLDLARDTYTVQITHARRNLSEEANTVCIDGFRVHGTLDPSSSPYASDGEANPNFLQLRDAVLDVAQVPTKADGSQYIPVSDTSKTIVDQVYASAGTTFGAVYLSNSKYDLKDLLDNGPKNELYLYKNGDTLTFTLDAGVTAAQIGLKAVNGVTSCTVNGTTIHLNTCTDMFYELTLTAEQKNTITVTNIGDSFVSITLLKYFSESAVAMASLEAEDVSLALYAMGYEDTQSPVEPVKPVNPFVDVTEGNRFYDAILWAHAEGITSGKTDTTFEPSSQVTRAQFVTFLWRAAGEPEPASQENPFVDVTEGNRFYDAILWAYQEGITSGKTKTTFCPDDVCTRGQVAMFLYLYAGSPDVSDVENPFEDVAEGNRFYNAILWAYAEGITYGKTETTFEINGPCTRAQVVTFLYRLLG